MVTALLHLPYGNFGSLGPGFVPMSPSRSRSKHFTTSDFPRYSSLDFDDIIEVTTEPMPFSGLGSVLASGR